MRFILRVEYKGKVYQGDVHELEEAAYSELVSRVMQGKSHVPGSKAVSYPRISINKGARSIIIPNKALRKGVVTFIDVDKEGSQLEDPDLKKFRESFNNPAPSSSKLSGMITVSEFANKYIGKNTSVILLYTNPEWKEYSVVEDNTDPIPYDDLVLGKFNNRKVLEVRVSVPQSLPRLSLVISKE